MESKEPYRLKVLIGSSDPFDGLFPGTCLDDSGPGFFGTSIFFFGVDDCLGAYEHDGVTNLFEDVVEFTPAAPKLDKSSMLSHGSVCA